MKRFDFSQATRHDGHLWTNYVCPDGTELLMESVWGEQTSIYLLKTADFEICVVSEKDRGNNLEKIAKDIYEIATVNTDQYLVIDSGGHFIINGFLYYLSEDKTLTPKGWMKGIPERA